MAKKKRKAQKSRKPTGDGFDQQKAFENFRRVVKSGITKRLMEKIRKEGGLRYRGDTY